MGVHSQKEEEREECVADSEGEEDDDDEEENGFPVLKVKTAPWSLRNYYASFCYCKLPSSPSTLVS